MNTNEISHMWLDDESLEKFPGVSSITIKAFNNWVVGKTNVISAISNQRKIKNQTFVRKIEIDWDGLNGVPIDEFQEWSAETFNDIKDAENDLHLQICVDLNGSINRIGLLVDEPQDLDNDHFDDNTHLIVRAEAKVPVSDAEIVKEIVDLTKRRFKIIEKGREKVENERKQYAMYLKLKSKFETPEE